MDKAGGPLQETEHVACRTRTSRTPSGIIPASCLAGEGRARWVKAHKHTHTHTHTRPVTRETDDKWIFLITIFRKKEEKRNGNWDNSYTVKEKKNQGHMVQRSHQILCPAWNLSISFWRKKQKKYLPNTIQMLSKTPCGSHHLSWESFTREIKTLTSERFVRTSVGDVDMYGCDSWTIKKAEHQRIDAFELWSWEDSWESLGLQGDPTSPS